MATFKSNPQGNNPWHITICTIFGVPIRAHLTLALLLLWVIIEQQRNGEPLLVELMVTFLVLLSIVLHELGHVFAARLYGVKTHEIVLYPFGGIARIAKEFTGTKELAVALAGPAVSALIAIGVAAIPMSEIPSLASLQKTIWVVNLVLCLFNLIPAYPMDGGRVLKAILDICKVKNATNVAASLGQVVSILMGAVGIYQGNPILVLIASVVFFAALSSKASVQEFSCADKTPVSKVMTSINDLTVISHGSTTKDAIDKIVKVPDQYFPVLYGSQLVGVVDRQYMLAVAGTEGEDEYLSNYVIRDLPSTTEDAKASDALSLFEEHKSPAVVVKSGEDFKGLIVLANLLEALYIEQVRSERKQVTPDDEWDI